MFEDMTKDFDVKAVAATVEAAQKKMFDQAEQNVAIATKAMTDGMNFWRGVVDQTNSNMAKTFAVVSDKKSK